MLTERNLRKRREIERGKTAVTRLSKMAWRRVHGLQIPMNTTLLSARRIAGSYGLLSLLERRIRELSNRLTRKGCENASMRQRGRRRQSSLTPGCKSWDTVKVRQGKTLDARKNGCVEESK